MLEHMASLAPSPYRYGSELALVQFPRFNDLGLFSEFAIANTVMEEPAPRREPALRLQNLYDGIGFVGIISGHDHEPRSAELSGSIHLQPLLDRARASSSPRSPTGRSRTARCTSSWILRGSGASRRSGSWCRLRRPRDCRRQRPRSGGSAARPWT